MELFSYMLSQFVHCWCIEKLMIFVIWFCTLLHCWSCLWCLGVCGWSFMNVWDIGSCCLKIGILWIFLYLFLFLLFLSCLVALARNSKTMLKRSRESGHPCPLPDFRGNGFSFSPLSMLLAIGLSYSLFNVEVYSFFS
jgi:hypothetical protein